MDCSRTWSADDLAAAPAPAQGWELSILGGDGLPPMRAGGRRIVRLPPALAYGSEGHLCRRGNKAACEVPPDTPIQIETVLLGRAY